MAIGINNRGNISMAANDQPDLQHHLEANLIDAAPSRERKLVRYKKYRTFGSAVSHRQSALEDGSWARFALLPISTIQIARAPPKTRTITFNKPHRTVWRMDRDQS